MKTIIVTGASGYLGSQVVQQLAQKLGAWAGEDVSIFAFDVRPIPTAAQLEGIHYLQGDIRSPLLSGLLQNNKVNILVHLASIVTPGKKSDRDFEYSVDVEGTANVLQACVEAGVEKIIVSSSGAAYGYHSDNPQWLREEEPIRGNSAFAYSHHKRLVEEMLAEYRQSHPQLKQVIFRIATILGSSTQNQITALFHRRRIITLKQYPSPFVFIWDRDVVNCIVKAIFSEKEGIYNLAADGVLTLEDIARLVNKKHLPIPVWLMKAVFWVLKKMRLTVYGPEQVAFLQYRPVLDNRKLKTVFGYIPQKTSKEVFEYYYENHNTNH